MTSRTARRWLITGTTGACVAAAALAATVDNRSAARQTDATAAEELPLGAAALDETRTSRELAPGVTHIAIERGRKSADDFWTVTIGVATSEAEAAELERKARAAGYAPRRDRTAGPDPQGSGDRPLGWMVRVGRYADRAAADRAEDQITARGLPGNVQHTSEDGHTTTGPWSLDVLVIDPARFRGRLRSELTTGIVPGRETTSSVARRTGALAAVNAGYFVIGGDRTTPGNWVAGTDGDPAGVSVVGGDLVSEAVNGRPALIVPTGSGRNTSVRRVETRITVATADGASREVTGLNRRPGLIVNCGGVGNATPFTRPAHDYTCGNADELIAVTPAFGTAAPEGPGFQATLDADGRVTAVREGRGGSVPPLGTVLQGTGTGAEWLRAHARAGAPLTVRGTVVDAETQTPLALTPDTSVVNGGPLLLRDGEPVLDPVRDGWSPEDIDGVDRAGLYNDWYLRRNPRTAAGVTRDGRILLLTVDGRRPGHSAGLSITETAEVMRGLGAVHAINLDGGGSTAMVVRNELQGHPSDPAGERPAGDTLVVLP
ncbi:phosphodiester glycosidase family protein [Streptomyces sp.]|uniref:phosphodiester glycosidase family protein n=1 Tax=Streptomyces sp. TaxID=1931 RepID=UPI002D2D860E|nr:phosphodiester glycosidase family protein [Streptomyces sp.]HZF87029.1 phosphodiester glycosidase family protein [Streptomyces sp.]